MVDSTPTRHGPPSTTASMRPSMSWRTWAAVVVLGLPERLAEGAATGTPAARMISRVTSQAGQRTATVSSPAGDGMAETVQLGGRRDVENQRVVLGPPLGLKNLSDGGGVETVAAQAVDGLGGQGDQPAVLQDGGRDTHGFGAAGSQTQGIHAQAPSLC